MCDFLFDCPFKGKRNLSKCLLLIDEDRGKNRGKVRGRDRGKIDGKMERGIEGRM
jgi:hypothetical protein